MSDLRKYHYDMDQIVVGALYHLLSVDKTPSDHHYADGCGFDAVRKAMWIDFLQDEMNRLSGIKPKENK